MFAETGLFLLSSSGRVFLARPDERAWPTDFALLSCFHWSLEDIFGFSKYLILLYESFKGWFLTLRPICDFFECEGRLVGVLVPLK